MVINSPIVFRDVKAGAMNKQESMRDGRKQRAELLPVVSAFVVTMMLAPYRRAPTGSGYRCW